MVVFGNGGGGGSDGYHYSVLFAISIQITNKTNYSTVIENEERAEMKDAFYSKTII